MAKFAKYSNNFFRNKDGDLMSKQAQKNMYKVASTHSKDVRSDKYVPISTGTLLASITGAKKNYEGFYLESIDYYSKKRESRYKDMGSNEKYINRKGIIIPAGKNRGKGKWFEISFKNNEKKYIKIANDEVLK